MKRYLWALLVAVALIAGASPAYAQAPLTANGQCVVSDVSGQGSVGIQVTGTFVGTLTLTKSIDIVNYVSLTAYPNGSTTGVTTITAAGAWTATVAGYNRARVCFTAFTSGTAYVTVATAQARLDSVDSLPGLAAGVATFLGTPTSANLAAAVTDETGTAGALVFSNSPTLVTPALGTPSAAVLTNATGLPVASGISGLGTGVATFLATPSSANLAAAVTDETGSGLAVFGTSPSLATPTVTGPLGLASVSTADTFLFSDGPNVAAFRNGTTGQTVRVYGTISGSDNERLSIGYGDSFGFGANVFEIQTTKAGAGTNRSLVYGTQGSAGIYWATGGSLRWTINASGHLLAQADNTYDIGASGATRPRSGYFGTDLRAGAHVYSPNFTFNSGTQLVSSSDGIARFTSSGDTSFTRLILGTNDATTNGGAIALVSGNIDIVNGNNTAYIPLRAGNITTSGRVSMSLGTVGSPALQFPSGNDGIYSTSPGNVFIGASGQAAAEFSTSGMDFIRDSARITFGSGFDLFLTRPAAGILRLANASDANGAVQPAPILFANLDTPANGTIRYCSDCTIANPTASGGTGAIVKRLNGVWVGN